MDTDSVRIGAKLDLEAPAVSKVNLFAAEIIGGTGHLRAESGAVRRGI